jgi:hypothetical protein
MGACSAGLGSAVPATDLTQAVMCCTAQAHGLACRCALRVVTGWEGKVAVHASCALRRRGHATVLEGGVDMLKSRCHTAHMGVAVANTGLPTRLYMHMLATSRIFRLCAAYSERLQRNSCTRH